MELGPPEPLPARFDAPTVFLAGSIDGGAAVNWQAEVSAALQARGLICLNPRREAWDERWVARAADPTFRAQVEWELTGLERADRVLMWFAPASRAPISLLELGLVARSGKVVVACPPEFWREGNVEVVCARYQVPLVRTLAEAVTQTLAALGR